MESRKSNITSILLSVFLTFFSAFAASAANYVIILDPGHGGNDPGACGLTSAEKDITLSVSKKIADNLKKAKGLKVVMTRNDDRWVWLTDRTSIANNNRADLFISIHCDSSKDHKNAQGCTVFYPANKLDLVKSNPVKEKGDTVSSRIEGVPSTDPAAPRHINDSKRFAKLAMARLTSTASRRDRGVSPRELPVLQYSRMPAVLIELDFISNPEQETYLTSEAGQNELAASIANAVIDYYTGSKMQSSATPVRKVTGNSSMKDRSSAPVSYIETKPRAVNKTTTSKADPKKTTPKKAEPKKEASREKAPSGNSAAASKTLYKIQFLISDRELASCSPKLKGLNPVEYYIDGKAYKYTYGSTTSREEANRIFSEVKKLFGDAFIITFKDGKRVK